MSLGRLYLAEWWGGAVDCRRARRVHRGGDRREERSGRINCVTQYRSVTQLSILGVSRVRGSIHPTAAVDPTAELGPGVQIGAFAWIGPKVRIGADSEVMHHASVMSHTVLGERNQIYPNAVIGADAQDKKYIGEECWLHVGDRNVFRENVTVNRGTGLGGGATRLGDDCLILAGVHIAHDCVLGNRIIMANGVQLGGHVSVQDGAGFGGLSAVHHYVTIGRLAFVGGMTRVTSDAPPFLITEGHPSRVRAVNKVGLKRAGVCDAAIAWLKEAQRLLYSHRVVRREAFELLEKRGEVPDEGIALRAFLRASEQGSQGRARQP